GDRQLDLLAVLLSQRPGGAIALHGRADATDVPSLRDAIVLEQLRAGRQDADTGALVAYLAPGGTARPPGARRTARLERLRSGVRRPGDRLDTRAGARAEAARERLVDRHGIAADRVRVGPTTSGPAAVTVELEGAPG